MIHVSKRATYSPTSAIRVREVTIGLLDTNQHRSNRPANRALT
jgi:hypothetical protein